MLIQGPLGLGAKVTSSKTPKLVSFLPSNESERLVEGKGVSQLSVGDDHVCNAMFLNGKFSIDLGFCVGTSAAR